MVLPMYLLRAMISNPHEMRSAPKTEPAYSDAELPFFVYPMIPPIRHRSPSVIEGMADMIIRATGRNTICISASVNTVSKGRL